LLLKENLKKANFIFIHFTCLESEKTDTKPSLCPDYSQYLYFLFAPTLIYRDQYPRNTNIRWDFVARMFGQVLAAMFYVYYVVVRFCVPTYAGLNQNEITLPIFMTVLFNSIMPGSLFLLLGKINDRVDKGK
jgi:sterol O-acyltransferase